MTQPLAGLDFSGADPHRPHQDDLPRIRAQLLDGLENLLPRLFPQGRTEGHAFVTGDICGSPGRSLRVELAGDKRGLWHDFATGEGGDVIDLWAATLGLDARRDFPRVLDSLRAEFGLNTAALPSAPRPIARGEDNRARSEAGRPSAAWNYLDPAGRLIASVYRYDTPSGKSFRPWDATRQCFGAPEPRPLYNLPGLVKASQVVLVEGEKCAQALIDAGMVATTAMQGARAPAEKTDWSPLRGKDVVIWPDHDAPGRAYAEAAAAACLAAGSRSVAVLMPPADKPAKWDAADAIAEGFDWRGFLARGTRVAAEVPPPAAPPAPRIRCHTLAELLDDDSPLPPDLIAPRVLTPSGLLVFGGAPKVGKSDFLLAWLAHLAAGLPFLGMGPSRPLRVFYLQAEVHYDYLRERLKALVLPDDAMRLARVNLVATPQLKMILDEDGVREAIDAARRAFLPDVPDVIAIDPIRNVYDGGDLGGENENGAMLHFLSRRVDVLRDAVNPQAGVILVHHTRKLGKKLFEEDPFQALAGAGSLRGYYSSGLLLYRPDEATSLRQLLFELRNGPALAPKHVDKVDGRWQEVSPGTRLVMREHGARLDAERIRKRDVILEILHEEAAHGRCYTMNQFAEAFEGRSGLGSERAIRIRISALATQGFIKFFRNVADYGFPSRTRTQFGYLCVEGMELRLTGQPDPQTGEVATSMVPVLPTHFKCPGTGSALPVENPSIWIYPEQPA